MFSRMQTRLPNKFKTIRINGKDAVDFAHRIFSRNLKSLSSNEALPCLALSPQGRIVSWFWISKFVDQLDIFVEEIQFAKLQDFINTYHFQDELKLTTIDQHYHGVCRMTLNSGWRGLDFSFVESVEGMLDNWDLIRFQKLIPDWKLDAGEDSKLVFEFGLEDLCDENKGCYIGQEIIERVRSRTGRGRKSFCRFESDLEIRPNSSVYHGKNHVGQIHGSVFKASKSVYWALGFLDTETLRCSELLSLESGQTLRAFGPGVETRTVAS